MRELVDAGVGDVPLPDGREAEVDRDAEAAKDLSDRLRATLDAFVRDYPGDNASDGMMTGVVVFAAVVVMSITGMDPDDFAVFACECAKASVQTVREVRATAKRTGRA